MGLILLHCPKFFKKLSPVVTVKTNGYVFQQHLKSSPAILISFYAGTESNNFNTKFTVLLRLLWKLLFSIPPEVSSCLTLFHVICISITFLEEWKPTTCLFCAVRHSKKTLQGSFKMLEINCFKLGQWSAHISMHHGMKFRWCTALFRFVLKKHPLNQSDLLMRTNQENPS